MATASNQNTSIFQASNRISQQNNQYGLNRSEWWLNVNYAEVIEIKDAVGIRALKMRARS